MKNTPLVEYLCARHPEIANLTESGTDTRAYRHYATALEKSIAELGGQLDYMQNLVVVLMEFFLDYATKQSIADLGVFLDAVAESSSMRENVADFRSYVTQVINEMPYKNEKVLAEYLDLELEELEYVSNVNDAGTDI